MVAKHIGTAHHLTPSLLHQEAYVPMVAGEEILNFTSYDDEMPTFPLECFSDIF